LENSLWIDDMDYIEKEKKSNPLRRIVKMAFYDEFTEEHYRAKHRQHLHTFYPDFFIPQHANSGLKNFCVTKSRQEIIRQFILLFGIRSLCQQFPALQLRAVNSVLFEGVSGIGKTDLIKEWLKIYHAGDHKFIAPGDEKGMTQQLEHCFHNGMIAVIDELNTYPPYIEKVLNKLLDGYDSNGRRSNTPGFFFIGTQNSIAFKNRRKLGDELVNRMQKINCPPYECSELKEILQFSGLLNKDTSKLADEFYEWCTYNLKRNKPLPTIRELLYKAEGIMAENHQHSRTGGKSANPFS
jgi:hypothetical protein